MVSIYQFSTNCRESHPLPTLRYLKRHLISYRNRLIFAYLLIRNIMWRQFDVILLWSWRRSGVIFLADICWQLRVIGMHPNPGTVGAWFLRKLHLQLFAYPVILFWCKMRRCSANAIFVQKRLYADFMLLKCIAGNLHGKKLKSHTCFHAADYLRFYFALFYFLVLD